MVLFVDTFSNYFEPENARAALAVLRPRGLRRAHRRAPADGSRPLCCGRTFLAAGMVEEARAEARRVLDALEPYVGRGVPVVGLEPSCILGLRDEFKSMLPGGETDALAASALLFEEFIAREHEAGRLALQLKPLAEKRALLHGHCHQKAFGAMPAVQRALSLVPELKVETIESSCCGMAGSFGYEAAHYDGLDEDGRARAAAQGPRGGRATRCSSPTAPAAAIRSPTARREKRSTSRKCWRARLPR